MIEMKILQKSDSDNIKHIIGNCPKCKEEFEAELPAGRNILECLNCGLQIYLHLHPEAGIEIRPAEERD